ncbi:MAG: phosphonate transporter substrate-binding protein [Clostridia bacterium]|jgi:phosphonate transport system substrate-binding protein|nr:phosphonate transporter substrate-binding protein [Clostridia bacterium]
MKKLIVFILCIILLVSLTSCAQENKLQTAENDLVFKIGAIPDQNAADLNRNFSAMAEYLSTATGLKVEFVPSVDYAALVTAFGRGEIHMAWFGGLTSVQAINAVPGAEAIVQRPRDAQFHSVFIAQKDLNVNKLEDLKSLSFTFGSESSTSGHLMPRYFVMETGLDPAKDFDGAPNFSGSHDNTYNLVQAGTFQAGALNEAVWEKAVAENKVDLNKVKVFYTTPVYYDYNWTINSPDNVDKVFGEGTIQKVKDALLSMNEEQAELLKLFQTDKFIETKNENYIAIETVAKKLGIIK